jgi:hypothetical protein
MARAGLEPARLAAQASKTCVAASYTTGPAPFTLRDTSHPVAGSLLSGQMVPARVRHPFSEPNDRAEKNGGLNVGNFSH